jgi:hypothetical protein
MSLFYTQNTLKSPFTFHYNQSLIRSGVTFNRQGEVYGDRDKDASTERYDGLRKDPFLE